MCRGIAIFHIFAPKHRLWVLGEAVLTCTHNLCFEQKINKKNIQIFAYKFFVYCMRKFSLCYSFICLFLFILLVCANTQQNRNVKIIVELNFLAMNKIMLFLYVYFTYKNSIKTFISYMRKAYIRINGRIQIITIYRIRTKTRVIISRIIKQYQFVKISRMVNLN